MHWTRRLRKGNVKRRIEERKFEYVRGKGNGTREDKSLRFPQPRKTHLEVLVALGGPWGGKLPWNWGKRSIDHDNLQE